MNFNGIAKPSFLLLLKFFGKLQRNLNKIDVKLVENTTYFFLDLIISTKKDNFLLSLSAYHITGLVLARVSGTRGFLISRRADGMSKIGKGAISSTFIYVQGLLIEQVLLQIQHKILGVKCSCKGHLISKCHFCVFKSTKKPTKFRKYCQVK